MSTAILLLAAGQGTRMNSDLPKVLHPLAGAPLIAHALRAGRSLEPAREIIVLGHGGERVAGVVADLAPEAVCVTQEEQLGTGHAVAQCGPALEGFAGDAVVLYADTPFIGGETLTAMKEARASGADIVVLGFEAEDPTGYGRLVTGADGLEAIVEHKDASVRERAITLCNSGVVMADAGTLLDLVSEIGNDNAKGEYYLTDIVAIARARGLKCTHVTCPEAETLGINSRPELARAEAIFQTRARAQALADGVTLTAPETVFFALDTVIGRDTTIAPYVTFGPDVTVESGVEIRSFCHLEGCHISEGAQVGPYARLRPGAEIGEDARIGNFVEIKAAEIGRGAKVNHLSYVGDANVGELANIGAGTITCNYDGVFKHRTEIGEGARIGAGAYVGSGGVISQDVPEGDMAIARARQVNKPGLGRKLRDRLLAKKKEQR